MLSDAAILKKIEQQPRRTAAFKQLTHDLGLHGEERSQLHQRLHRLVKEGQLVSAGQDRFTLPAAPSGKNMVTGRLSAHRDGFGFVTPDQDSLSPQLKPRLAGDVFIPPHAMGAAMHGDRVLVEVGGIRPDGRAEGRILKTIIRAHATIVGTFHYAGPHHRQNYVTPIDQKVAAHIVIPEGMETPPKKKDHGMSQHRVIGAEAAVPRQWDDLEGLIVDVEITDWPTATQSPRGRVIDIIGRPDDFGVDVEIMIRKFHLPNMFPPEVLAEAQSVESVIPSSALTGRQDFRNVPIVTIDGETARDFDDAVHVRELENGNYELQVHIADVAHYVTPDSPLDREARLRGTSVYFPDRAVPMLPLELSTGLCSLRPQVDRLVLSCVMEIGHDGDLVSYTLSEGVIRSVERMTYTDVNAVLEGDAVLRQKYVSLSDMFEKMRDLAMILNRKRERRGSIDFDLPEAVIEFDDAGLMKSISRSQRNVAHRIVEEFMLAANECVASHLERLNIASLYRIHDKPDAKRVYDFEVLAAAFGYSLGVGALPIQKIQFKSDRRASYGTGKRPREIEIPKEVHITPRMYQKLTKKIAGKPEERIVSFLMLRSLKQARYSEENSGHFALAAPSYTHFTSPIRRYPDLIVHRILKEVLSDRSAENVQAQRKDPSPWSKRRKQATQETQAVNDGPIPLTELHNIAEESSRNERRAADAERELVEWKKVKFMEDKIGEDFDGLIISVAKYGFFVELTDLFVEGLVPLSSLHDDHYTYHENTREIIGQRSRNVYSIGQKLRVIVDRIDPVEKKIQFAILSEKPRFVPAPPKQKKKKRLRRS